MASTGFALRSRDPHEVAEVLSGVVGPFSLSVQPGPYDSRMRSAPLGPFLLTNVAFGNSVHVDGTHRTGIFILEFPVAGRFDARSTRQEVHASRTMAHIVRADLPVHIRPTPDCRFLLLTIDADELAAEARALGEEHGLPDELPEALPLTGPGASLARCMEFLDLESQRADSLFRSPAGTRSAAQMLLAALVGALDGGQQPRHPPEPGYVKRAEEFMVANLAHPIGIADVVASSAVSLRTLYHGFRARHQVGPMTWLRRRRLERVHAELAVANPRETTVSEVALRWGFSHLGRFALQYRTQFGSVPSQTLRRP